MAKPALKGPKNRQMANAKAPAAVAAIVKSIFIAEPLPLPEVNDCSTPFHVRGTHNLLTTVMDQSATIIAANGQYSGALQDPADTGYSWTYVFEDELPCEEELALIVTGMNNGQAEQAVRAFQCEC